MDKHIIPARIYPNTEKGYLDAVEFDAYAWFEQATDAQIAALDAFPSGTPEKRAALNAIAGDLVPTDSSNWKTDILGSAVGKYLAGRHALEWLKSVAYGFATVHAFAARYPGVIFTDAGATRFALTAGWILGVSRGDRPLGLTLAREFDAAFKNLSSDLVDYEVRSQYRPDAVDGTVKVPRGKVVVSDDGTFGGFTLAWYYPLRANAIIEKAREIDPDAYTHEEGGRWQKALYEAKNDLRVRGDLVERRSYWPADDVVTKKVETEDDGTTWTREVHSAGSMSQVYVEYAFAYNGAMIYRGPSCTVEPFSVNFAGDERLWTVHT